MALFFTFFLGIIDLITFTIYSNCPLFYMFSNLYAFEQKTTTGIDLKQVTNLVSTLEIGIL